ncbi:MAG: ABC transporter permease [Christensenellales bacterium]|jgi:putative aldouronate transport system permease protein
MLHNVKGADCLQTNKSRVKRKSWKLYFARNWQLYLLLLPVIAYYIVFHYMPMLGLQIAFKDYSLRKGIWGSRWVGFEHFNRFFNSYYAGQVISNTLLISLYSLAVGMPLPIILALLLNEVRSKWFKKTVQTVTYAPYFISTVVLCSMIFLFLSPDTGIINRLRVSMGYESVYFMGKPSMFKTIYVLSGVWQNTGWNSIIYMAALSGIDPQLHEAAMIDGAGRLRRIWHINLPGLIPTMVVLLILNSGSLMSVGFEKIFLLQNDLNRSASEVISTLVYQQGLIQNDFSYSTAVNLFNAVINFVLLVAVNQTARRVSETSLW